MEENQKELLAATMSRRANQKRLARHRHLQHLRGALAACFFGVVLLFMATVHIGRVPIQTITVTGNLQYSDDELKALLPFDVGDAMYRFDGKRVGQTLLDACPYLKKAEIQRSLSGELTVCVEERVACWALWYDTSDVTDGIDGIGIDGINETSQVAEFVLLDESLYALAYCEDVASMANICTVYCEGQAKPAVGETLSAAAARGDRIFAAWKKEHKKEAASVLAPQYGEAAANLADFLKAIASCFADMTASDAPATLDLRDRYDVQVICRDGTTFLLGSARNVETDMTRGLTALASYRKEQFLISQNQVTVVDLRDASQVFIGKKQSGE